MTKEKTFTLINTWHGGCPIGNVTLTPSQIIEFGTEAVRLDRKRPHRFGPEDTYGYILMLDESGKRCRLTFPVDEYRQLLSWCAVCDEIGFKSRRSTFWQGDKTTGVWKHVVFRKQAAEMAEKPLTATITFMELARGMERCRRCEIHASVETHEKVIITAKTSSALEAFLQASKAYVLRGAKDFYSDTTTFYIDGQNLLCFGTQAEPFLAHNGQTFGSWNTTGYAYLTKGGQLISRLTFALEKYHALKTWCKENGVEFSTMETKQTFKIGAFTFHSEKEKHHMVKHGWEA